MLKADTYIQLNLLTLLCEVNRVFKHSWAEDFGLLREQSHTVTEVKNGPQCLKDRFCPIFFFFLPSFYSPSCCFTSYLPSPIHLIRFSDWLIPRKISSVCFTNKKFRIHFFSQVVLCHFILLRCCVEIHHQSQYKVGNQEQEQKKAWRKGRIFTLIAAALSSYQVALGTL